MDVDPQSALGVSDGIFIALVGYGLMIIVSIAAALLIRGIVLSLQGMQKAQKARAAAAPAPVQVSVAPEASAVDDTARHVAAIAAAVYTVIGAHRLIYIGEAQPSIGWTTTGRTMHQTSHSPKRSPQR